MTEFYIGVMSGTSLDAIDGVVVSIESSGISLLASNEFTIPGELRQKILGISMGQETTVPEIGRIDHQLGKLYAVAVNELLKQAKIAPSQITAIGNHGQTVYHEPDGQLPFTMQLGDANLIAALTGIDTVADFRRMDIALGGQGAPLAPAFHQYLFEQHDSTTVVLNVGGIANITVLPRKGGKQSKVLGFDTGPGNILMDAWCEKHTGKRYDKDAQWAKSGKLNRALLDKLMSDPYLAMQPPKSTGREHYHLAWLEKQCLRSLNAEDVQRTLCEFTAASIEQHINPYKCGSSCEVLVCGGGANNPLLLERLKVRLPEWNVLLTSDRGVSEDYLEAMAFAWLARQRIHNQPNNMPSVTGAKRKASLGVLYSATGGLA